MIDEKPSSALLFAWVDADSAQDGWKEVISPIDFKGQIVVLLSNGRNVLGGAGIDRAGILASNVFLEPPLIRDPDTKTIRWAAIHDLLGGKPLKNLEIPKRRSLSRVK